MVMKYRKNGVEKKIEDKEAINRIDSTFSIKPSGLPAGKSALEGRRYYLFYRSMSKLGKCGTAAGHEKQVKRLNNCAIWD